MGQDAAVIVDVRAVLASLSPEDVAKHRKRMKGAIYARAAHTSAWPDPTREPLCRLIEVLNRHESYDVRQFLHRLINILNRYAGGAQTRPKWAGGSRGGLRGRLK